MQVSKFASNSGMLNTAQIQCGRFEIYTDYSAIYKDVTSFLCSWIQLDHDHCIPAHDRTNNFAASR